MGQTSGGLFFSYFDPVWGVPRKCPSVAERTRSSTLRASGQSSIVRFTLGPAGRARAPFHASKRAGLSLVRVACVAVAALGFFAVVLWPSRSFAAIVPACENDFVSRVAAPSQPAQEQDQEDASCDPGARGDDIDNSRVAPICDNRGASSIAPPRLHGVSDARFDRGRPCEGQDTLKTAVHSGRGDPPMSPPEAVVEHVVLPTPEIVGQPSEVRVIELPVRTDGPRSGVTFGIYHPPR